VASIGTADANPTRAFFVRMITRDISLEDCIFDLIDNSIDGAWKLEGGEPMTLSSDTKLDKYKISIETIGGEFIISDNCGGISLTDAAEYAFTFGRKDDDTHEKYSIGVYGIGMKRAIFKIGKLINITSTYKKDAAGLETFEVPINVPNWVGDTESRDWDFDIQSADHLAETGVKIVIRDLTEAAAASFEDSAFLNRLRRSIARDYTLHLHRGITIELNGQPVQGWQIELREGGEFVPLRTSYKEQLSEGVADVEVLAGMTAPPPEDSDPEAGDGDENRSGWYVICNGRVVLAADKTDASGWGTDGWPKWHPQYAGFIGIIIFSSENAELLPMTTTKRNVDASSPLYRRAMPRMREVSRAWISYTNNRKQDTQNAKRLESETKPQTIFSLKVHESVNLPKLSPKPKIPMANILYSMPRSRVRQLAEEFGNINYSYKDVGVRSFNYAYAELVGDDE
jgi:hypothetical protein